MPEPSENSWSDRGRRDHAPPAPRRPVSDRAYHKLPELIARRSGRSASLSTPTSPREQVRRPGRRRRGAQDRWAVRLSHRAGGLEPVLCTFCVGALYARSRTVGGRSRRSWPRPGGLAEQGVREITLLGQNVNAYAGETAASRPPGPWPAPRWPPSMAWTASATRPAIRDDMGEVPHRRPWRDLDALMPYLHLPVQAGSDKVLKAMNRAHGQELPGPGRHASAPRGPDMALSRRSSSSASRARPRPTSRRRSIWSAQRRLRLGLLVQI